MKLMCLLHNNDWAAYRLFHTLNPQLHFQHNKLLTEVVHCMTSRQESPSLATSRNHSPASLSLHSSCSNDSSLFLSDLSSCRLTRSAFAEWNGKIEDRKAMRTENHQQIEKCFVEWVRQKKVKLEIGFRVGTEKCLQRSLFLSPAFRFLGPIMQTAFFFRGASPALLFGQRRRKANEISISQDERRRQKWAANFEVWIDMCFHFNTQLECFRWQDLIIQPLYCGKRDGCNWIINYYWFQTLVRCTIRHLIG